MNDIIQQFIDEQPEVFPDETDGDGYRCSVTLKDGTFLPCVMLRESTAIVELAMRRFEEEREGRGLFGKPDMEAYRDIVRHFVTSGNRCAGGVLRDRIDRTTPSITVIPTPGRLPSSTDSSMSLPGACWAWSISTKSAGRPTSMIP